MKDDRRFLCHLVNQALGITQYSYPMYQNAPRPTTETFAAVRLEKTESPQRDVTDLVTLSDGTDVMRTYASRILTLDVLFVGEDEYVNTFDSSFYRQDIINKLDRYGYGFLSKGPIDLKNTSLETDWEFRNGLRLKFHRVRITDVSLSGVVLDNGYHDIDDWSDDYIDELIGKAEVTVTGDKTITQDFHIKR